MTTSIKFLAIFLTFLTFYTFWLGLVNQNAINTDDYITVPTFPTEDETQTSFLDDVTAVISYFFDWTDYYIELFTMNDFATFVTYFIITPCTLIAVFIFITEILIPFIVAIGGLIPFT